MSEALHVCRLLAAVDKIYAFDKCRNTWCKYHGVKARGHCIANHTLEPCASEIEFYKGMTQREAINERNDAKKKLDALLILMHYAQWGHQPPAPLDSCLETELATVLNQPPYSVEELGLKVNAATLLHISKQETYDAYLQKVNSRACEKMPLFKVLSMQRKDLAALNKLRQTVEDEALEYPGDEDHE